jgi:hypothetical protein
MLSLQHLKISPSARSLTATAADSDELSESATGSQDSYFVGSATDRSGSSPNIPVLLGLSAIQTPYSLPNACQLVENDLS